MKTRAELDGAIDRLAVHLPALLAEAQDSDLMAAFAGLADEIEAAAVPADEAHVWSRLECILRDNGLMSDEDEHDPD